MGIARKLFRLLVVLCLAMALGAPLNAQTLILRVDGDTGFPTPAGNGETWPGAAADMPIGAKSLSLPRLRWRRPTREQAGTDNPG